MRSASNTGFWPLFIALGAAWGSTYLFIKIAVETLSPFTLVASRLAIGTAVLAVVVIFKRVRMPRDARTYLDLTVLAVLNLVVPFSLTSWGQQSIDSGLASVLNATIPLFTALLAAALLADERLSPAAIAGLVVGFGGVVILTVPSFQGGIHGSVPGEAALLGSSVSYAAAAVYVRRRLGGVDAVAMAFLQVGLAFAAVTLLAFVFEHPLASRVRPETAVSILWLGVVASGLAYIGLFRLIEGWGSTRTSTIAYLLPVVGVALGWSVLGETVDGRVLLGAALVVGGIAIANRTGVPRLFRLGSISRRRASQDRYRAISPND